MHEDRYRETSLLVGCVSMAVLRWRFNCPFFLLLLLFSLMSLEIMLGYQSLKKSCYFVLLSNLVLIFLFFFNWFFSILFLSILFHLIFISNLIIILLIVISFDLDHFLNWIFFSISSLVFLFHFIFMSYLVLILLIACFGSFLNWFICSISSLNIWLIENLASCFFFIYRFAFLEMISTSWYRLYIWKISPTWHQFFLSSFLKLICFSISSFNIRLTEDWTLLFFSLFSLCGYLDLIP